MSAGRPVISNMRLQILSVLIVSTILHGIASAETADEATKMLSRWSPWLYGLYQAYQPYHAGLREYARHQGFQGPFEQLGTVVHEIIHLDSFRHRGFLVNGSYYEPYVAVHAWPNLTNEQVMPYLMPRERGVIFDLYMRSTPNNHLGNIVDEINAYGHVLPFICQHESTSTGRQARSLIGFLHVAEVYLRTLRTIMPGEYQRLTQQEEARGAIILIIERAWSALRQCGTPDAEIPAYEVSEFITKVRLTAPKRVLEGR